MHDYNIIEAVRRDGRTVLTEIESKRWLKETGIPTTEIDLATTEKEAVSLSRLFGFPVVLKISSPDISHKSDAGGVKVGLNNSREVSAAYRDIMAKANMRFPSARIEGVAVQNMARPGIEVIIGITKDPQFGPVIMFGLGGIWVELLKDVSFRLIPITQGDAALMIREIKGYSLLKGFRNYEPVDIPILEKMLVNLSGIIEKHSEIKEIDLNPVIVYKEGAIAVDARIILEENL